MFLLTLEFVSINKNILKSQMNFKKEKKRKEKKNDYD